MSAPAPLRLEGELTIQHAAEQHQHLLQAIEAVGRNPVPLLQLDLGQIEACDSAGVQLLLALRHSLEALGCGLRLEPAAASVLQVLDLYGLRDTLAPEGAA